LGGGAKKGWGRRETANEKGEGTTLEGVAAVAGVRPGRGDRGAGGGKGEGVQVEGEYGEVGRTAGGTDGGVGRATAGFSGAAGGAVVRTLEGELGEGEGGGIDPAFARAGDTGEGDDKVEGGEETDGREPLLVAVVGGIVICGAKREGGIVFCVARRDGREAIKD